MSLIGNIRARQLSQIGIDHTNIASTPDIPAAQLQALMADINAVGQYVFTHGPGAWWGEGPAGDRLKAPTTLTVGTTADSKTITGSFLTYMHGCTVRLAGEWNRIFQTGVSTWQLMIPAVATNASASMVVYHDCLNLTDTSIVISHVMLDGYGYLQPANSLADLEVPLWYGFSPHAGSQPQLSYSAWTVERQVDIPRQFAIDGTQLYGGSYVTQIRFNPLPNSAYALHWMQREKFSKVTAWSDSRTTIVPHDYTESVFIPLVLERLLGHPAFEGDKDVIREQANLARDIMQTLSRPQERRDVKLGTKGVY
jgi:hypothetical protein